MDTPVLHIQGITKSYGPIRAVRNFSLEVRKGEVVGILGPNGSGKTTLLSMLLDILKPDAGSYHWFGNLKGSDARKKTGSLLEMPRFYPYMSARRNLEIVADIKGAPYHDVEKALETVGLLERKNSKYKTYSLGMKQKLAIAATLIGHPEVLIYDEPTNGLDPKSIAFIRNLIKKLAEGGATVILASHLLDEVQKVCSHVVILNKGETLHSGRVDEVLNTTGVVEIAADDMGNLYEVASSMPTVDECKEENGKLMLRLKEEVGASDLNKMFVEKGIYLSYLSVKKKSLESYFLDLLKD